MSVSQKELPSFVNQHQVVCHHWEIKQHLVYLCITVPTYCYNVIGTSVQCFHNTLGVNSLWNGVARTIIQNVPEDAEHVAVLTVVELKHLLQCWQTSVDV